MTWCLFGRNGIIWGYGKHKDGLIYFNEELNFTFDGDIHEFSTPQEMLTTYISKKYPKEPFDKALDFFKSELKRRFPRSLYDRDELTGAKQSSVQRWRGPYKKKEG